MTKQPEALRLAKELDAYHTAAHHKQAAAELRRLHAANQALDKKAENARELGLDYEPEQEPVAIEHCIWARNGNTPCPHTSPPQRTEQQPAVPDAIHHTDLSETLEYIQGWNDCRAEMLRTRGQA